MLPTCSFVFAPQALLGIISRIISFVARDSCNQKVDQWIVKHL